MNKVTAMRVAAFSTGIDVPSARFRVRQYLADLQAHGIEVTERHPLRGTAYPPPSQVARVPWLLSQLIQRTHQVFASRHCDLAIFQRQMVSTINTLEGLTARPRLLDVDDAIWQTSRFDSVDKLARRCDGVICGNAWLAEYFSRLNRSIHIVPTAVDSRIWKPRPVADGQHNPVIGWIGTGGNLKYLYGIEPALQVVLREVPRLRILIICDREPKFKSLSAGRVIFRRWDQSREVTDLQEMTVGIMPLEDSSWARGKCSFKMLQYMACGIPAVVSPVGMNQQVASKGGALLAATLEEWSDSLINLVRDGALRAALGRVGREVIERDYSTEGVAARLAGIYRLYA